MMGNTTYIMSALIKGNYLWVAEFDIKKGSIKPETLKQCMDCTEPWEKTPNYKSAPVMEGPTVMKWDGVYYLFYSANHFMNIDYSVGYATASSPFGPWKKHPEQSDHSSQPRRRKRIRTWRCI